MKTWDFCPLAAETFFPAWEFLDLTWMKILIPDCREKNPTKEHLTPFFYSLTISWWRKKNGTITSPKNLTHIPPYKIRTNERKRTMKILHRRESATCCWLSDFVFISVFFFLFLASFEGKWRIVAIFVFFSLCRSVHRDVERKRTEAISATVRRWQYFRAIC